MKLGFILGSHPALSMAELSVLLPNVRWEEINETVAWTDADAKIEDLPALQIKLGGTVKIVEWLFKFQETPSPNAIAKTVQPPEEGKFVFGFSRYIKGTPRTWKNIGLDMKKRWRDEGYSVRFITTREPTLSTIVVVKEGLIRRGADFCLLPSKTGNVLARTLTAQDPREFAKRDYGKARRPTRVGMLPVKLAMIMINLANVPDNAFAIDPFMGSGTVLMELLLAGHDKTALAGSDLTKRGVDHTRENLWEARLPVPRLDQADAQELHKIYSPSSVDAIITEGHLGLPRNDNDRRKYKGEMEGLYENVLASFSKILKPDGVMVIAFPAYVLESGETLHLNLAPAIKKHGFEPHRFSIPAPFDIQTNRGSLIYGRPHQHVHRDIYILHKR